MKYAILDEATGSVVGISELESPVSQPNMVLIPDGESDPWGKRWNGSGWEDMPPVVSRIIPRQEFIDRWDFSELVSLKALASGNDPTATQQDALEASVFWEQVTSRDTVNLDSALAVAAKTALVNWGILTSARADEVFA